MTHTVLMTQYNSCSREFLKARRDLTFYCKILPFLSFYSNYSVAIFVILNTNLAIVIIAAASKFQFFKKIKKIQKLFSEEDAGFNVNASHEIASVQTITDSRIIGDDGSISINDSDNRSHKSR